ncbi:MAG: HRDC domain-containing protein [Gammaproteobacteria bacterium]|nr:HRDC domain-containing protein [Gammaproteobacteria bacterium]
MDSTHNANGLIGDAAALAEFAAAAAPATAIGIDTEFMRERTYYAQLCLLQLSVAGTSVAIDTLALADLAALQPVFARHGVRKLMHAARQDLEVLYPVLGALAGIYDTQVAAGLIGLSPQIGYADLVQRLLGTRLHKSQTRTDWSHRPLSPAQLAYALDDARYLEPLRRVLDAELERLGRRHWFEEEMAGLDGAGSFAVDPAEAWKRIKGLTDLDDGRRELAQQLAAWREQRAMAADRPRGWILPDAALRDIVLRVPRSEAELARTAELPEGIRRNSGPAILGMITTLGLPAHLPPPPGRQRPDPQRQLLVRRLASVTQEVAAGLGIAPELLATRRDLERLAAGTCRDGPLAGWRRGVIGEPLLAAL